MRKLAILAFEVSGDYLGASLIRELRQQKIEVSVVGVGGDRMLAEGFQSWFDISQCSILGIPSLQQLYTLFKLRRKIAKRLIAERVDAVIGIDSPDISLAIERRCKSADIPTWHWVSPEIWAWRSYRVHTIGNSCDEVLCLFPNEPKLYLDKGYQAHFVGHQAADQIPLNSDPQQALQQLSQLDGWFNGLESNNLVCLMPGSRDREIRGMAALFLNVARQLSLEDAELRFVLPVAQPQFNDYLQATLAQFDTRFQEKVYLLEAHSGLAMQAAQTILLASGTATLEALLYNRKMLVVYTLSRLEKLIFKYCYNTDYVSLPNYLAGRWVVTELIGDDATEKLVYQHLKALLHETNPNQQLFNDIHQTLAQNSTAGVVGRLKPSLN